jgi:hypothetical protein
VDDPLLSCNSRLGVRVPRQLPKGARHSLQVQVFAHDGLIVMGRQAPSSTCGFIRTPGID